ncbi:antibiotic biosynthesis monooxygenase [Rathayibacter tritici]|uniref:Antibiotic biosynthesis monooxygenase n=1 Tax=Rathayibacter tritici TaxID=33888 RepID=A0A160KPB9_9MICO|nr:putative quinol monooxygenase [Rathayibacter tritici]AND15280.1 antibiotic biosynthesis monooxygenase [Rathayibacter tritici]PPF25870.1 antibiotic biosynthesis monooxygenase [Rathayibacter tritici]PPF66093.1 antibiotic biosynthesis monooxygenase [Rathayibacter tritici]PPG06662.1 antibiotic biosynthesis monooxygenase [Rathayibacter tritici]PPI18793.1 antibiotic biosynthesis monooxygenase [Rathayibacter tritici]
MSARILVAEFTALPGNEETVAGMIADLAVLVRQEPGNVEFVPYRREDDPARFFVYEVYRDEEAFQAHISADYGAVFNERLGPLIVEPNSQLTWLAAV